jgi:hypothetical protein
MDMMDISIYQRTTSIMSNTFMDISVSKLLNISSLVNRWGEGVWLMSIFEI